MVTKNHGGVLSPLEGGDPGVKVRAEFPDHGVYIHGELVDAYREDGGEVIGHLPAFRIVVQGHTRPHAERLLEKLFVEFCEVAVENKRLWEFLIKLGFKIVSPDDRQRRTPANFLYITETDAEGEHDVPERKTEREFEFAGAAT